ncbi:uncharacterized protein [Argopecten irradians]|uniref:uncharacterized protein n=1 Tax=Argopecten irradians TaxID=31199 RepID=UPI0037150A25
MIFGCYYLMEIPVGLQNEMIYSHDSSLRSNTTQNQTKCRVCLGLGEFRYNLMFSATRWMSVAVCLPSGFVIDKLGNGRSAVLFSTLLFLGSVVFAVGATTQAPVSTPVYLLMLMGYASLAFGDASLRFVQARVISHCFPEATLSALAVSVLGYIGEAISLYITPIVATTTGVQTAVWLGPAACGIGVFFAIGLAILIQVQTHTIAEDKESKNIMSVSVLKSLPRTYWLFMFTVSFTAACWMVKQANLPDYLEWRHGYSMLDASHIVAISPSIYLSCPLFCLVLISH